MFTYSFTRDLNVTTPRRHTLERSFVNSDPKMYFLRRRTYQGVPYAMYFLRVFNINAMCLASDTTKRGGIQK